MKIKKILSVTILSGLILTGCYGGNDTKENAKNNSESSSDSKTFHLAFEEDIPTLKTNGTLDGLSDEIMQNIYEGLYRQGKNDEPEAGVAKDYEEKEDGNVYIFNLREDAAWSNGETVTAEDFVYAWKKMVHPDTISPHANLMEPIKNSKEIQDPDSDMHGKVDELGVEAVDDHTLKVTLDEPVPFFIDLVTNPVYFPQNEDFVNEHGDDYALEADTVLSNGPYEMTEWNHDENWKLEKNEEYWDAGEVKTQNIETQVVKDNSTEVNLYETDDIDVASLSSEFIDEYEKDEDLVTDPQSEVYFLRMNEENKDLQNSNIRHALDIAYNKDEMTEGILKDGSEPAYFLIPSGFEEFETPSGEDFRDKYGDFNNKNVDEAQNYFDKGLEELDKDEISLEFLSYDDDQRKSVAEYIKNQWESNISGLEITINQQPNKQKLDLETKQDYDVSHSGWRNDVKDPVDFLNVFKSDGSNNVMSYENEKYDELIDKANHDFSNDEKRFKNMQEAEKILLDEDAAISPMYVASTATLEKSYVKDYIAHPDDTHSYKWVEIE